MFSIRIRGTPTGDVPHRFLPFFLLLCVLCASVSSVLDLWSAASIPVCAQQQQFSDASEISRDLLYQPALAIEPAGNAILFRAARFTYRFDPGTQAWQVTPEKNFGPEGHPPTTVKSLTASNGVLYRFSAAGDEKSASLEIREGPAPPPNAPKETAPLVRVPLWSLEQLHRVWRRADAEEAAEPEVAAVAEEGAVLWLAIRFYAGEGWRGIGTLVRFDTAAGKAEAIQPRTLERTSLTHIVLAGGFLWLGTELPGEDSAQPTLGLVRLDPATGAIRNYPPGATLRGGSILTALRAIGSDLWVATDAGICRVALPAEQWTCWRITPMVELTQPLGAADRPGAEARGALPPGRYEVRWANAAFFEVVTPDAVEGWADKQDLAEYERQQFDLPPYLLANGSVGLLRVLDDPEDDPLEAAQVYRARIEKIAPPEDEKPPGNFQRVRVRIGWIPRASLTIIPVLQPVTP